MENENKNLYYLHDLSDYKVASGYPDVRGWKVKDAGGKTVGKVEGLLVNKAAERVVYLDVEIDEGIISEEQKIYASAATQGVHGFLNEEGENHLIIPIGMAELNEEGEEVHCSKLTGETFSSAKRYTKGQGVDRNYEVVLYEFYSGDKMGPNERDENDDFYNHDLFTGKRTE